METSYFVRQQVVELRDMPSRKRPDRLFRSPFDGSLGILSFEFVAASLESFHVAAIFFQPFRAVAEIPCRFFGLAVEFFGFGKRADRPGYVFSGGFRGFAVAEFVERKRRQQRHFVRLERIIRGPALFRYGGGARVHVPIIFVSAWGIKPPTCFFRGDRRAPSTEFGV